MIDKDFVVETTKINLKNAAVELDFGHEYTAAAMTHEVKPHNHTSCVFFFIPIFL
jgi:hypothetical protein